MAKITASLVAQLRSKTGAGMMDCKKALTETDGDLDQAVDFLRKKGLSAAAKKSGRAAAEGLVVVAGSDKVGAMVEVNAETDFVAKNEEFQDLAREIAMHVAASAPQFVKEEEISEDDKAKAKEIFAEEAEGKPEEIKEKIISGKLDAYFAEKTLMNQPYIKNPEKTISQLVDEAVQKFGEKVEVGRIARFSISD